MRSWSREARERMGPRRLREEREREKTLPPLQTTPSQLPEQASLVDQFERRFPYGSDSDRNRSSETVSFWEEEKQGRREKMRRGRRKA